jgi:hypothetical protein
MAAAMADFASWIEQADIPHSRLTPEVQALLQAVFRFRQRQGSDYYSTRLLSHFLLHCDCGLKVAQIARLLGLSRPAASTRQGLSSKEVIRQAHHRLRGRPYGKLLPRYAGAIAGFLLEHKGASRADLLDFIERTFGVRVSRIALYKFLKKFGLDQIPGTAPVPPPGAGFALGTSAPTSPPACPAAAAIEVAAPGPAPPPPGPASADVLGPALVPVPEPAPPFSTRGRSTPAPSC